MTQTTQAHQIDCSDLSLSGIDLKVKDLIFNGSKRVILKNVSGKQNLLEGLKGGIKIEIIGDVFSNFANDIDGPRIIVNGNVGDNSCLNIKSGKVAVFGSCGNYFGNDVKSGEFYILENCGKNSFLNFSNLTKLVIGGQCASGFLNNMNGGVVVVLNLIEGNLFIDKVTFRDFSNGFIYFRGNKESIKLQDSNLSLINVTYEDEDIYLPLISEFARLFNCSLGEIKSKPFYKAVYI